MMRIGLWRSVPAARRARTLTVSFGVLLACTLTEPSLALGGGRTTGGIRHYSLEPRLIEVQLREAVDREKRALEVIAGNGEPRWALGLIREGYVLIRYAMGGVDLRRQMRYASPLLKLQKAAVDRAMEDIRLAEIEVSAGQTEPARLAAAVPLLQRAIVEIEHALTLND